MEAWAERIEAALQESGLDLEGGVPEAELWLRETFPELAAADRSLLAAELVGWGPLEALLRDPAVTDIHANGGASLWIEREGLLQKSDLYFRLPGSLDRLVRRLLQPLGRKVDRKNPVADGRLPDGSRFCVVVAPAVVGATHLSIRKFKKEIHSLAMLEEHRFCSRPAVEKLRCLVSERKNILVCGPTGAGKTTLLNALALEISPLERVITIEDTAELQLQHPHVVALEARPPNSEGEGEISLRSLVKASLRLRPDRILLGECRGEEALDLLQAFNTGHGGSFSTIHANSPREALHKLEMLALLGARNLDASVLRAFIQGAIHALVHVDRVGGKRFVKSIQELRGAEAGTFLLRDCAL